jgi:hypothetical protein
MPADIDPNARPDASARCPRRLLDSVALEDGGRSGGPRCRAIVLVQDADEHERWHEQLDDLFLHALTNPDDQAGLGVVDWPDRVRHPEPAPEHLDAGAL